MAKKQVTQDGSAGVVTQQGKQEKKQAKREAKAMLAVDVAREKVAAAERKLAKAQLRLEIRRTSLQAAEAHLAELRNAHAPVEASEAAEEVIAGATGMNDADGSASHFDDGLTTANETGQADEASASSDTEEQRASTTAQNEMTHPAQEDNSLAADQSSEERSASSDEDLLPEDNLPVSETDVDVTPIGEATPSDEEAAFSGESEAASEAEPEQTGQAEQVPWWKRVSGNQGQHAG
jgi:hypothetical protein